MNKINKNNNDKINKRKTATKSYQYATISNINLSIN